MSGIDRELGSGRGSSRSGGKKSLDFEDFDAADDHPLARGGPVRNNRTRDSRQSPYGRNGRDYRRGGADDDKWTNDRFNGNGPDRGYRGGGYREESSGPRKISIKRETTTQVEESTTVIVSNLDEAVEEENLEDIFSEVGDIVSVNLNYDRDGNSKGSAEIEFKDAKGARKAVTEFDLAEVDGKPMSVKILGTIITSSKVVKSSPRDREGGERDRPVVVTRGRGHDDSSTAFGRGFQTNRVQRGDRYGGGRRGSGGRGRGGRSRGGGRGGSSGRGGRSGGYKKEAEKTAAELDAEMDAYMAKKAAE